MGLRQKQIDSLLGQWLSGAQKAQEQSQDVASRQTEAGLDLGAAQDLRDKYGPEATVAVGKAHIGGVDPLTKLLNLQKLHTPQLTPAQETSEREAGKKLSAYEVAGGSPAMQKHMSNQKQTMDELKGGQRDWYDRAVGKVFGGVPGLLGVFGPSEKARMDRVQAAAIQNIRATDPNPAQILIDQTLSRAYDPRLSDEENIAKIQADYNTSRATQAQMERASDNLQRSGYAMPGIAGNPSPSSRQLPQDNGDKVVVISPDGRRGMIPRANLQRALQQGYKAE